ncbi:9324_t:CDS:1 [Paraglomus occultum]|uniref:9324_t:CDS:1 n=1 Tax=Paraglomus occultum TaxID=144539 RepID=A0A9N9CPI5_9GLOM|nr:9324_t:CDS:1 [Paraglomus occultum]
MFSHLRMKYIFFLLAIATIVAGVPLEKMRNSTLKQTQTLSLSRRAHPLCPDPRYPVFASSFCRNERTLANVCEAQDFPNLYDITDRPCEPDSTCVDFVRIDKSTPLAGCIHNNNIRRWNNGGDRGLICSKDGDFGFRLDANTLIIGVTTYDANSNPTAVDTISGSVGGRALGRTLHESHFSAVYKNYRAGQTIKMCFDAGSRFVTAVAAAFVPGSGNNDEFTVLSLE